MITINIDLTTGLAKPDRAPVIKAGSPVSVAVVFSAPPGDPLLQIALSKSGGAPAVLAYLDTLDRENDTTFSGLLDANDTRLIAAMAEAKPIALDCEVSWMQDGERQVAANFSVTAQPRIVTGPESSDGGPVYLTNTETAALYEAKSALHDDVRANIAPVNSVAASISGSTHVADTLTGHTGTWTGALSYTWQWLRCNSSGASAVAIDGATSATYVLTSDDLGATIRVRVTAAGLFDSASSTSAQTAVIAGASPANNLYAFYKLKADANDSSGNARHLTNTGSVTFGSSGGIFSGSNYLSIVSPFLDTAGDRSFGIWVKGDPAQLARILRKGSDAFDVYTDNTFALAKAAVYVDGMVLYSDDDAMDNTFHFIKVRYTHGSGTLEVGIDGGDMAAMTGFVLADSTGDFRIGGDDLPFTGNIKDVACYDTAVSDAIFTQLYNSGTPWEPA